MFTPVLQTLDLSIGYKSIKKKSIALFDSINIELKQGELIGLLGINGVGKSTFLRTIAGFQPALSGEVIIHEKKLAEWNNAERAKLFSVVLSEKIQSPNLTVTELLQISRMPYMNWSNQLSAEDKFQIEKAIALTDIDPFVNRRISNLSDGQLQRVLVARAFAQDTSIIFLDEPSSHLDLNHKVKLYQLLKDLCQKENKTILFSSHDIDLTLIFADTTIVMKPSNIVQGATDKLIEANVFTDFFDDDILRFDPIQKRFIITQ